MGKYEFRSGKDRLDNPWQFYQDRVGPRQLNCRTKIGLAFGAVVAAACNLFGQPTAPVPPAVSMGETPVPHVLQLQNTPNQPTIFEPGTLLVPLVAPKDSPTPAGKTDVVSPTIDIQPSLAVRVYTASGACTGSAVGFDARHDPPQVLIVLASHCMPGEINTGGDPNEWINFPGTVEYNPTGDLDKPGTMILKIDAMRRDPTGAGSLACYRKLLEGGLCYGQDLAFLTASGNEAGAIPVSKVDQNPVAAGTILTMTGFGGMRRAGTITMTYGVNVYGPGYDCVAASEVSAVTYGDSGSGLQGPNGLVGVQSAALGTGLRDSNGQEIMNNPVCASIGGVNEGFVRGAMHAFETGAITTTATYTPDGTRPWIQQDGYTASIMGALPPGMDRAVIRIDIPNVQKTGCDAKGEAVGGKVIVENGSVSNGDGVTRTITVTGHPQQGTQFRVKGNGSCPNDVPADVFVRYPKGPHGIRINTGPLRIEKPDSTTKYFPYIANNHANDTRVHVLPVEVSTGDEPSNP